jgi:lipoate-protein ligase A
VILWLDDGADAPAHMARDAALLAAFERGERREPVLRLFTFAPPGITLGHAQDPARELDLVRCRRDGVAWAVRPTGGRAIFHAEEWTYALATPLADRDWGGSLAESYARMARLLVASLRRLGAPVTLAPARGRGASAGPRGTGGPAAPCFASTTPHEIELEGRKAVGSAQRRLARALLQQGSVLLGEGHLRLADYLALPDERRARVRSALARGSAPLGPHLATVPGLGGWSAALRAELPAGTRVVRGPEGLAG